MKRDAIAIKDGDNVATALRRFVGGETVTVGVGERTVTVTVTEDIEFGHKFALIPIEAGRDIIKYGEIIGRATAPIGTGGHVHVHNIESLRGRGDLD